MFSAVIDGNEPWIYTRDSNKHYSSCLELKSVLVA